MVASRLRAVLKSAAFACATVLVAPALVSFTVRGFLLGRDRALEGSTQALAGVPGLIGDYLRRAFLARTLTRCHRSAVIGFGTIFSKAGACIDENAVIGPRCHIGLVHIERNVLIGPGCHLPSGGRTHGTGDASVAVRDQTGEVTRVRIGEGAWIGSAVVVMADVGAHTVVAAGSVVHQPLPSDVIAGGVPARTLSRRVSRTPSSFARKAG